MKRAYIACGMTGIPLHNWPHFEKWEADLTKVGWDIVSPTRIDEECGMVLVERLLDGTVWDVRTTSTFDYEGILKLDFEAIETCDAIILLPGWTRSSGAKRELAHALALGLEVYTAEEALNV